MDNALGQPQTIILLGGTSEIGLAIVRELLSPTTRTVVLACRDIDAGERAAAGLRHHSLSVDVVRFDAIDTDSHAQLARNLSANYGDIDVAIIAFALLGEGAVTTVDQAAAVEIAQVNFMLSSVAGERVRRHNPVYGGTKAGIDGFAQGFGDALTDDGVHMLVVRPGFVRTRMTAGLKAAPFSTTPEKVAVATVKALRARRRMVWVPATLRPVFSVLRHLPGPVWRRLPLG